MERTEYAVEVVGHGYVAHHAISRTPGETPPLDELAIRNVDEAETFTRFGEVDNVADAIRRQYIRLDCLEIADQVRIVQRRLTPGDWAPLDG